VKGVGPSSNRQTGGGRGRPTSSSTTAYLITFIPIRTVSAIRKAQESHRLESTETSQLLFAVENSDWAKYIYRVFQEE